jgi:hypothetical protein
MSKDPVPRSIERWLPSSSGIISFIQDAGYQADSEEAD